MAALIQPDPSRSVAAAIERMRAVPKQIRYAGMQAINDVLFAGRAAVIDEMRRVFDPAPTPYIARSALVRKAERDRLSGEVYIDFWGRGKGVAPEKILAAEVYGGQRRPKRAEVALQRIGLLPRTHGMVPAAAAKPHMDAYGNVKGGFLVQMLSYLQAFGEQGYRANMTAKRMRTLARIGKSEGGFKTVRGVEYFVSRGRMEVAGRGSWQRGKQQHLPAGIWRRTGIHGSDVAPVFLFVPLPRYRVRLPFHQLAQQQAEALDQRLVQRLGAAMATAR